LLPQVPQLLTSVATSVHVPAQHAGVVPAVQHTTDLFPLGAQSSFAFPPH
jgi:hypothetical protein